MPKKNVIDGLSDWRADITQWSPPKKPASAPTCGTMACFGGWCCWWPSFIGQGIQADTRGGPELVGSESCSSTEASLDLFGYEFMFDMRGGHPADEDFKGDDHACVTNRLKWLLNNSVVV